MRIDLDTAMHAWLLNEYPFPAINSLELFKQYLYLFKTKKYLDQEIPLRKNASLERRFIDFKDSLKMSGFTKIGKNYILRNPKECKPADIICSIYPYTYISYLTAMRHYSLTDRLPTVTQIVSIDRSLWKKKIDAKYVDYLNENSNNDSIRRLYKNNSVSYPQEKEGKVVGFPCKTHSKRKINEYKQEESGVRVIVVGDLFLEMLENFDLCGGIDHVIDIYINYSTIFTKEILKSLPKYSNITQAKVGFLFEKVLKVNLDDYLQQVKKEQQDVRGGSRKFIANEPYSSVFSPDWNISLNYERLEKYGEVFK